MNPSLYGYRIIVLQNRKSKQRLMEVFSFLTQPDFFFVFFFLCVFRLMWRSSQSTFPPTAPAVALPFPFSWLRLIYSFNLGVQLTLPFTVINSVGFTNCSRTFRNPITAREWTADPVIGWFLSFLDMPLHYFRHLSSAISWNGSNEH